MLESLLLEELSQDEYLNLNNIALMYKKLPIKVNGFIFIYKYRNIIVINNSLSEEKKKKTILHEFAHFELNHLCKHKELLEFSIEYFEDEADRYIQNIINSIKEQKKRDEPFRKHSISY